MDTDSAAEGPDVAHRNTEAGRSPIDVAGRVFRMARRAARVHAAEFALISWTAVRAPLSLIRADSAVSPASEPDELVDGLASYPVLLVHGFCGSKSSWSTVAEQLRARGAQVRTFDYAPFGNSVDQLVDRLVSEVQQILSRTGADKVQLVGHSLGGLLVAQAVIDPRLTARVDTVITLGAPFGGSPWARLLPIGGVAQDLRDGSPLLTRLAATPAPSGIRWLTFSAPLDFVVPGARSVPAHGSTEQVTVTGVGHLGMLLNRRVVERIAEVLVSGGVRDAVCA